MVFKIEYFFFVFIYFFIINIYYIHIKYTNILMYCS